jgi:hypothetical protein
MREVTTISQTGGCSARKPQKVPGNGIFLLRRSPNATKCVFMNANRDELIGSKGTKIQ